MGRSSSSNGNRRRSTAPIEYRAASAPAYGFDGENCGWTASCRKGPFDVASAATAANQLAEVNRELNALDPGGAAARAEEQKRALGAVAKVQLQGAGTEREVATSSNSCASDSNCGSGYRCVKPRFEISGTCMQEVDLWVSQHTVPHDLAASA